MSKTSEQLRNAATAQTKGAPGRPAPRTILQLLDDPRVGQGIQAVAGKYLNPDRMLRLCVGAIKRTPRLLQCDPSSVLGAMMTSAALGLEPNTVQQQAFLIPYKRRAKVGDDWVDVYECQFQIGYRGYITLAYRHPRVRTMEAHAIHERDHWKHQIGSRSFLEFSPALKDRGETVAAFSYVSLHEGGELSVVLPLDELHKIRDRSETYRSAVRAIEQADEDWKRKKAAEALAETPWVMWFDAMAAKTAIRAHSKQLPIAAGDQLALAAAIDNDGEGAPRVDLATMANPEVLRAVMADEIDPPALTHDDSEGAPFSGEAFGTREREPVTRTTDTEQKPEATQRRPRAAAAPRSARAPAPPTDVAPGPDDHDASGLQASFDALLARMKAAKDEDARAQLLDLARSSEISAVQFDELRALYLQLKG